MDTLIRTLNLLYKERPALWELDFDWQGFRWIDANDTDQNVLSFLRFGVDPDDRPLACVANLSPVVRHDYRIGLPKGGWWREVLNTDAPAFWGSGVVNGSLEANHGPWHGLDYSTELTLPPLAVMWLEPEVPAD